MRALLLRGGGSGAAGTRDVDGQGHGVGEDNRDGDGQDEKNGARAGNLCSGPCVVQSLIHFLFVLFVLMIYPLIMRQRKRNVKDFFEFFANLCAGSHLIKLRPLSPHMLY